MKKIFGFILILLSGCYTVIKHPNVNFADSSGEIYTSHISYKSNCVECHSSSAMIYFYNLVPAHVSSPWSYYNTPWWLWWSGSPVDTVQVGSEASPERSREFGSHRATSDNNSFNPPPPTRTPPKSGSDSGTSTSSTMEKDGKSNLGERKNESSRDQGKEAKQDSSEKRNIGSRRR
jgi:hypothetical protein